MRQYISRHWLELLIAIEACEVGRVMQTNLCVLHRKDQGATVAEIEQIRALPHGALVEITAGLFVARQQDAHKLPMPQIDGAVAGTGAWAAALVLPAVAGLVALAAWGVGR